MIIKLQFDSELLDMVGWLGYSDGRHDLSHLGENWIYCYSQYKKWASFGTYQCNEMGLHDEDIVRG